MQKTVFLFVDKPAFTSDLLRTRYIEYLASQYRVVVFTRALDQQESERQGYFQSPNIIYCKWKLENSLLFGVMKFLRFSCIREFDYLKTTQFYRKRRGEDNENTLLRVLSWPFSRWLTSRFFNKLEMLFVKKSKQFANYNQRYNPALVIVATPGLNS